MGGMNYRPVKSIPGLVATIGLLSSLPAVAADRDTPSFYITAGGGYTVYKSEMVQSNDTSTTVNYGFGVYAGQDRQIGMSFQREQGSYAFPLNGASIVSQVEDMNLRYRYGPVYLGLVVNNSQLTVSAPPDADDDGFLDQNTDAEEYMKVMSTGMGGNFGVAIPIGKSSSVYLDVSSVTTSLVQQSYIENADTTANGFTEKEISLGPRTDIDLGGSIGLVKSWLDMSFGFKQRTLGVTVDGTAFSEAITNTYISFVAGWQF
jgi:hypothetical protein